MKSLRNILLIVFTATIMFSVVGTKIPETAGIEFPKWTNVGKDRSTLEGRDYSAPPTFRIDNIISGRYQSSFEQYLSDHVPMRDTLLLSNSVIQHSVIVLANLPFSFNIYPTFYESTVLFYPEANFLVEKPLQESSDVITGLTSFAKGLSSVAKQYPNIRFTLILVDRSNTSSSNPAHNLVSSPYTTEMGLNLFNDEFSDNNNVNTISVLYSDESEYFGAFFSSDHHWNDRGAIDCYNAIANKTNLTTIPSPEFSEITGKVFQGWLSREGLFPLGSSFIDSGIDYANLVISHNDGSITDGSNERVLDISQNDPWCNYYALFYGNDKSENSIIASGNGCALLIHDSYGNALRKPLATNFNKLFVCTDIHSSDNSSVTLSSRLQNTEVQNVFIVAHLLNYSSFSTRHPTYFE